jgi:protein-tyrosine phosphatase
MGNICRSPAAEGIFKAMVEKAGLTSQIHCDSAGTIGFHSRQSPDRRMCSAAQKRGYHLTSLSRQVRREDFVNFNHIVVMDFENHADIKRMTNGQEKAKVSMMCDFASKYPDKEVPDPYYGGERGFEHVLDLLEDACQGLLDHICSGT